MLVLGQPPSPFFSGLMTCYAFFCYHFKWFPSWPGQAATFVDSSELPFKE